MANGTKIPLWTQRCTTEDYHCRCKVCKSAQDHANLLLNNEIIDNILDKKEKKRREKIMADCEFSTGKLSDELLSEVL